MTIFTNRVKHITITKPDGSKLKVTTEKQVEKTCEHNELKQIHHILWKCLKCDDFYFIIPSKIVVIRPELVAFGEAIADDLGAKLTDK